MFGDESPVSLALELSLVVLKQFIRDTVTFKIGKRNGIGILLYNTKKDRDHQDKKESESNDYKEHDDDDDDDEEEDDDDDDDDDDDSIDQGSTVHELLSLAPPGVKQVQTIRSFLKEDRDFRQEFCCEEEGEESRIAPLQTAIEER